MTTGRYAQFLRLAHQHELYAAAAFLSMAQRMSHIYEVNAGMWFGVHLVTGEICIPLSWVSGYCAIKGK